MKYQPTFDQVICVDLGYTPADGMLIDLIISATTWANKIVSGDQEYYFLAQSKIMNELPCVFGSKPAVTRAIKRISAVLDVVKVGRSNYYRITPELACAWCSNEKGEGYSALLKRLFRKWNSSESGTIPKVEPINQLINTPIKEVAEKGSKKRFVPPTVEQVAEYCKERANTINPEKFVDFYASKGWMVGSNKMKDWEACVRTWEQGDKDKKKNAPAGKYEMNLNDTNW